MSHTSSFRARGNFPEMTAFQRYGVKKSKANMHVRECSVQSVTHAQRRLSTLAHTRHVSVLPEHAQTRKIQRGFVLVRQDRQAVF